MFDSHGVQNRLVFAFVHNRKQECSLEVLRVSEVLLEYGLDFLEGSRRILMLSHLHSEDVA